MNAREEFQMSAIDMLTKMDKNFKYVGSKLNEISFPLGGIGAGSIGLAGNGRLVDWEIFNHPNKRSNNGFSFFAIKAEYQGVVKVAKVLNGDLHPPFIGSTNEKFRGFGFGVERESMAGFPHFEKTEFTGQFPFAQIEYLDQKSPLDVRLTAFNPFIPLNDKDSSLPVAIFTYEVTNRSQEELDVSLVGCLSNPFEKGAVNEYFNSGPYKGIKLHSTHYKEDDPKFGDLTLSTDGQNISYQSYWYRGGWFDNLTVFWKEFHAPGRFKERNYNDLRGKHAIATYNNRDVCVLSSHKKLAPMETGTFRFMISWNIPNFVNYWNPGIGNKGEQGEYSSWKNYYATLFDDSTKSSEYTWTNLDRLHGETLAFKESLFTMTLPDFVIDAISSNLSILKSPTCVRLTDGTLYGFEGCHGEAGCCEGSCTHVWNYEQATPFLFPSLARSMRQVDYKAAQFDNGKMSFRLMLPVVRTLSDVSACAGPDRAAADGQMGGIIKTYREWKICGDTEWLKSIWPKVKKGLEYAWAPDNPDWWDRDKDGVMEGVQHHTLDVEIYGPNTYITGQYHAALLAASEMAKAVGDADGETYIDLYEKGRKWIDENLFNGQYFFQKIDLQDEKFPVDPELEEIKYQIGEGCHIDQVLGQWYAHVVGLGYIFDPEKVKKAVRSIYKYNYIDCMRDYANACRIYAINDERGLLICTWPNENSPKVPVPYADECMNGFEYQAACHMIYEGLLEEGLTVVQAIRDRYDGERRNPWNEFECGSNYARSMASYSLLLALSGFEYDMTEGRVGFNPKIHQDDFRCFWSLNRGWGEFVHQGDNIELIVKYGQLDLNSFHTDLLKEKEIAAIYLGENEITMQRNGDSLRFDQAVQLDVSKPLRIMMHEC
jgi:non-lysosomal glucosylceramidase